MSAVTSYAGGALGNAMHLDKLVGGIDSPLKNLVGGMIGGTTIGGAFGGLAAVANGQDFGQGAWTGAKMGFISGSISGLGAGVQYSLKNKVNLFTGKPNPVMSKPVVIEPLPIPRSGLTVSEPEVSTTALTDKASGSYLLEFESGNSYAGKGLEPRMNQSINRIETNYGDKCINKTFYPAPSAKAAFINEHNLMMKMGGPIKVNEAKNTYNLIFSPGRKYGGF